jgi:hypothetical protein
MAHTTTIIDRDKERKEAAKGDFRGPTPERVQKSLGDFVVGGDERTTRIYHFTDTPLSRLYKRFAAADKSDDERKQLTAEHVALIKYRHHWYCARMESRVGASNLDRVQSSQAVLEGGESYAHHLIVYRNAARLLGMWNSHIVEHIACLERSASDCAAFGLAISPYQFRKMLRESAAQLAEHWGTA